jgi:hypothetical protein
MYISNFTTIRIATCIVDAQMSCWYVSGFSLNSQQKNQPEAGGLLQANLLLALLFDPEGEDSTFLRNVY